MNIDFNRKLSIAPMLDCTDRHERYFLRLLSKHVLLYSEMITANSILHAGAAQFFKHDEIENPVALQLGGSVPKELALCAKMVEQAHFDEVNLNCGCPSERVQNGAFGACLMKEKFLVADCFKAMQDAVSIPVSIKCRIGVDNFDSWDFFYDFIDTIACAGCKIFIVHARKAWLKGLSPKENREIPPLNYEFVHKLKKLMPNLNISINGGIHTLSEVKHQLEDLDGVMVGREAYENPWFLLDADEKIFNDFNTKKINSRKALLKAYLPYVKKEFAQGTPATILVRHLYGLFNGLPGAKKYRNELSCNAPKSNDPAALISRAMNFINEV